MADEPSDNDIFDSVISSERNAEPAQSELELQPQEKVRDEAGRFATETPKPTQTEHPSQTQEQAATTPEVEGRVAAVQAERQKRQDAERRAEELERRLAALESRTATQTPPQAVAEAPDFWSDPNAYINSQLTPVQQAIAEMRELQMETRAEAAHGAEKLAAAKKAAEPLFGTPAGVSLYQEINAGGNPYDNLVKWHEKQQTLSTVGNDPQAWLQSEIDKKLADPEFLAQAIERARSGAAPVAGKANAPLVNLPPSLSRIPASGGGNATPQGEQSDDAMFSSITSARRR